MFLISSRFRRWLVIAIALPLAAWLLALLADRIGRTRGESRMTRVMRAPQQWRQHRRAAAA